MTVGQLLSGVAFSVIHLFIYVFIVKCFNLFIYLLRSDMLCHIT